MPVSRSFAVTVSKPSALRSNVTSICGAPRFAAGRLLRLNLPRLLFPVTISLSP